MSGSDSKTAVHIPFRYYKNSLSGPIQMPDKKTDRQATVNEIFYSIQGESSYAGSPCIFVRLTGCNLRCTYCDTRYAFYEGIDMNLTDIRNRIGTYNCRLVEITGGEPLIQKATPQLIDILIADRYTVLLETNGSQDISTVNRDCIKIMDIKCPSSGEEHKNDLSNIGRLEKKDEVKFVIGNREDYEYAKTIVKTKDLTARNTVFFSPVSGTMQPDILAKWILNDQLEVRLNIQLHKIIWGPNARGV